MNWMQPLKEKDFFGMISLPERVEDAALERSGTDFESILLRKIGAVPGLKEQHEMFGFSEQGSERKTAQKEYKDRLFKFIFGNPDNKQWTLSLYNAMNGTDYTDPDGIRFNTIGDAVYMGMKNDVSFIICFEMNLWEHQSSFNPNMPMRFSSTPEGCMRSTSQPAITTSTAVRSSLSPGPSVSASITGQRSNRKSRY